MASTSHTVGKGSSQSGGAPERLLVFQTAFLGDLLLTIPLIQGIANRWPECEITVVVHQPYASLMQEHPAAARVLPYAKRGSERGLRGMISLAHRIRQLRCQRAYIPHRSFRSSLLLLLAGVPERIGFSGTPGAFLYTGRVKRDPQAHEMVRNLELLEGEVSVSRARDLLQFPINKEAGEAVTKWLVRHNIQQHRYVVFAPGSVWATKRYGEAGWHTLSTLTVNELGFDVVLAGGNEDRELALRIAREAGPGVHTAAGELSISESLELIRGSALLVTNDSAPLHMAQAGNTPSVALFGPTIPEFGFGPTGPHDEVIGLELACRPCAIHGSDVCPLGHHHCMQLLPPESIFQRIAARLRGTS